MAKGMSLLNVFYIRFTLSSIVIIKYINRIILELLLYPLIKWLISILKEVILSRISRV